MNQQDYTLAQTHVGRINNLIDNFLPMIAPQNVYEMIRPQLIMIREEALTIRDRIAGEVQV